MTADEVPFSNEVSAQGNVYDNIHINDSSNIHLGSDIQYYGPLKIQQYVNGLPEELATKPEVGQGLAKAGLLAATSRDGESAVPHFVTLLLPNDSKQSPRWLWISTFVVVFIAVLITVAVIILARNEIEQIVLSTDIPIHGPSTSEDIYNPFPTPQSNVTLSAKLRIIERREWLGQPVHHEVKNSSTVQYVLVMETGGDTCSTEALCKRQVLSSQQYDMGVKNLDDIAPNFLLGGDGYAYEGRNWNTENQCSLSDTFDKNSICISFVGQFSTKSPSDTQLLAAKKLIDMAVSNKNLTGNYSVLAVRQINHDSDNPGQKLFDNVKEWLKWKSNI